MDYQRLTICRLVLNSVNIGREGLNFPVGVTTRYGLDGPGIESRCRQDFPHPSRPAPCGPTQPLVQMGTGSFTGVKRPGRGADPPTSSAEVEGRVELYICSSIGTSWSVIGRISVENSMGCDTTKLRVRAHFEQSFANYLLEPLTVGTNTAEKSRTRFIRIPQ
jgi:hypothetical protein